MQVLERLYFLKLWDLDPLTAATYFLVLIDWIISENEDIRILIN
jgi:hypothetical protein